MGARTNCEDGYVRWDEPRVAELRRVADDYRTELKTIAAHFGISENSAWAALTRYAPDLVLRRRAERRREADRKRMASRRQRAGIEATEGEKIVPFASLCPRTQAWFMARIAEGR